MAAVEAAVSLMPQIAPRALIRPDREHRLGRLASLAGQAAAIAVNAGLRDRAVELLEQARGLLIADVLDAHSSDLTRLRQTAPDLVDAFDGLRARLDRLDQARLVVPAVHNSADARVEAASSHQSVQDLTNARREAYAAWEDLLGRIRAMDGFATFLHTPGIIRLAAQAHDGPLILVYTDPVRCDALILTDAPDAPVRVVPLTGLTDEDAYTNATRFMAARRITSDPDADPKPRIAAQMEILDILAWLWDAITGPVLAALGHTSSPSGEEDWPRLWWCPVGVLACLPLHAAGHHRDLTDNDSDRQANPRTVLDRVIFSYTPTIRGLAYARTQRQDPAGNTTLIIAVPDAPGAPPLPGVAAEAAALANLIPGAHLLQHPTRQGVLAALPGHNVAHFACRGYSDWENPAASRLVLYDHQTTPLTVTDITALRLNGGLAYLSASDTSITNLELANEAVHFASAFQLAGYSNVVATLWPIGDFAATTVAVDFYDRLTRHGTVRPDTSLAASALHHATRRLRDQYPGTPTLWAAYTHTGI